ncbi:TPA: hypothetical protein I3806_004609 [Enterobacter cloacae]|nr:hypothetical protein [Enterobacter cloacae]
MSTLVLNTRRSVADTATSFDELVARIERIPVTRKIETRGAALEELSP